MPVQEFISPPVVKTVRVELAPVDNALHSLLLVARTDEVSGLGAWVVSTAAALSPQERRRHELVMIGFFFAIMPERDWLSFPAYLDHLRAMDPVRLRDKMLNAYVRIQLKYERDESPQAGVSQADQVDFSAVLRSAESYIAFLRERFPPEFVDENLETEAYAYAVDPPAMKELIVSHLQEMWDRYLAEEWARVKPALQKSVQAFRQVDFSGMSKLEAARFIIGSELETEHWEKKIEQAERLVFVPSAHVGPYQGKFHRGKILGVIFGARLPEQSQVEAPELSRAEMLVRLSALADDNRLRILKFIAETGEQCSPDIIKHLDLSQSAASRHLNQLTATGYLLTHRREGAKCYRLNPERIEDTLQAINRFLVGG